MTPETLHPCAHRIALTYPFTEHCWPFGPEYDVFKVDGRIFMITMTIRGRAHQVVNKLSKKAQQRLRPR